MLVAWGVISVLVALLVYFSRRKFSWLFLALSAGSLLIKLWGSEIQLVTDILGLTPSPVVSLVSGTVALLIPVFVIMMNGRSYHSQIARIVSALCFTLVFNLFLFSFWGDLLPRDFQSTAIYSFVNQNFSFGVSAGLIVALIELLFARKTID